jgi:hypothetical protein
MDKKEKVEMSAATDEQIEKIESMMILGDYGIQDLIATTFSEDTVDEDGLDEVTEPKELYFNEAQAIIDKFYEGTHQEHKNKQAAIRQAAAEIRKSRSKNADFVDIFEENT